MMGHRIFIIPDDMRQYVAAAFVDYASALAVLPADTAEQKDKLRKAMQFLIDAASEVSPTAHDRG